MKIGICCFPTVGGSGIAATQLAIELAKKDHEVHLISYDTPFLLRSSRHPNVTLELVDVLSYPLFKDIGAPYTILAASKMVELVTRENLDILHIHYAIPTGVSAYLTKLITNVPVVITAHGSDIHILGVDPSYNPIMSHIFQNVDGISTVSKFMKKEINDKFAKNQDVKVIYNPIDTEKYQKIESQICDFRLLHDANFVHVSNFRPVKDTPFIVETFAEVLKEKQDLGLILVGEGPERKKCEEIACKLGIRDNVIFQGVRSYISPIYNCATALLSASKNESFGLTLAEAMACETPAIAPRVGGVPEVIDHEVNGYIYKLGDKKSLVDYMIRLLDDENLKNRLGKAGREKVVNNFDGRKIADEYIEWYKETLKD